MITLKPGDYISTEGLTEEQYHAVAKAFMDAGAREGEYPDYELLQGYDCVGWSEPQNAVWHQNEEMNYFKGRQLTVEQVLGTSWQGDGLPPVGTEVECTYDGHPQGRVRVLFMGVEFCVLWNLDDPREQCGRLDKYEFSPIRTAAQRAEDEAVEALFDIFKNPAGARCLAMDAYAAIRDGKIPGVRLDDR